jgi:hypothetical protein
MPDLNPDVTPSESEPKIVIIQSTSVYFEIDKDTWMGTKDRNVVFVYNVNEIPMTDRDHWSSLTNEEWTTMFGQDSKQNAQIAVIKDLNKMTNA